MRDGARLIETTEVAKIIRRQLKARWPESKFSVRTKSIGYIAVNWRDGPLAKQVESEIGMWEGKWFDGQDDSSHYRPSFEYNGEQVYTYCSLLVQRDRSLALTIELAEKTIARWGFESGYELLEYGFPTESGETRYLQVTPQLETEALQFMNRPFRALMSELEEGLQSAA